MEQKNQQTPVQAQQKDNPFKKLKWYEHLAAGWPLILVFLGGAIGGACGGLAYGANVKVFNSKLSPSLKYVFSFLISIGCIGLYSIIIVLLAIKFPQLFRR